MKMNGIEDFMTPDCLDITEPNEETKEAIGEVHAGKNLKKVDMSSFETFMKSLDEIE